jgi:serine/threonine protein phosphatase PrpC
LPDNAGALTSPSSSHDPKDPARQASERFVVRSYARTDIGRYRQTNEDAHFRSDDLGLYIVADGMGGHAAGEVASAEAVDAIYGMVKRGIASVGDPDEPMSEEKARAACRLMEGSIQGATYMVFAISQFEHDKTGMGTTITAALFIGDALVIGQVGDSRIYQVRGVNVRQITEDHTLIAWQIKQGILSPDEARMSPHKNVITRAVGNRDYVQVDTSIIRVEPGDRYLLCSDGLHGYLHQEEIADLVDIGGDNAVRAFIDLANLRGGRDNITAVLLEVE